MKSLPYLSALILALLLSLTRSFAQCNNWAITATLTNAATCAANGSFTVQLSGPDAAGLSNIQYGIPLNANGFSLPLNSASSFSGIPPGSYEVSVVAECGGVLVGKNTRVTVPGNYAPPRMAFSASRASLNCKSTGIVSASIQSGIPPYTITLLAVPASYSGPRSFTTNSTSYTISNLPAGSYTAQLVDGCNSGTAPQSTIIPSLNPSSLPVQFQAVSASSCDTLLLGQAMIDFNNATWTSYYNDTSFKISMTMSGGVVAPQPPVPMNSSTLRLKLLPGKQIKDCYGQTVTWVIQPPCGPSSSYQQAIYPPNAEVAISQHCNIDFDATISMAGPVCFPVQFSMRHLASNAIYGPFVDSGNGGAKLTALPLGNYELTYTTADGYQGLRNVYNSPVNGNPYSVSVVDGIIGFNNYIQGFNFTTANSAYAPNRTVELFNGPAGYSFRGTWFGGNYYSVAENSNATASTLKFPPGNYVWKITDDCGVYYLPITVGAPYLYQFTVGAPTLEQRCAGLVVHPTGTARNNGQVIPAYFCLLKDGEPVLQQINGYWTWPSHGITDTFLITQPGNYLLVPTATRSANNFNEDYARGFVPIGYPNQYTGSYAFNYTIDTAGVDVNNTQGFLCKGAGPGQGQLFAKGRGGIPFQSAPGPHYRYSIALPGNGANGPYIATNTTGIFTGFGGNAQAQYDLKVQDSCGAFAVQPIKILDLGTSRLIASSKYVGCLNGSITLNAIYLPGATYSWTGPNGFTSTQRAPTIANAGPQHTGVYRVAITTTQCNGTLTDTTMLVLNQNPPKPLVRINCADEEVSLKIVNPTQPFKYQWDLSYYIYGSTYNLRRNSDSAYRLLIFREGRYNAVAIDTTTGCSTLSDTVRFATNPNIPLHATVYSPHLKLCPGDTTTLIADDGSMLSSGLPKYQWFRNGQIIPGATASAYTTSITGSYKVRIETGPCGVDTSEAVEVTNAPFPVASITAARTTICETDTAYLLAGSQPDYTYTWHLNGVTIPGRSGSTLPATASGHYYVTVSNGGCVDNSDSVYITVLPSPNINLMPNARQDLCPGDTARFTATQDNSFSYTWLVNGQAIPNAHSNTLNATRPGSYTVQVSTAVCPKVTAGPVVVTALPGAFSLGADTVICQPGSISRRLSVPAGYEGVRWSTGDTTLSIVAQRPGSYWATAFNKCGRFADTIRIRSVEEYRPQLPDDTLICNAAERVTLQVPALLTQIRWSTGETGASLTISTPGTYWVTGESPCGPLSDTVRVRFCPPVVESIQQYDTLCEGDCIRLAAVTSNYPQQYRWRLPGATPDSATTAFPNACYPVAGIYPATLIVTNAGGSDSMTIYIVVASVPVPRFDDTTITLSYKKDMTLPACADAAVASWYQGDSLICGNCRTLTVTGRNFRSVIHCVVRNGDCADSCDYKLQVIDIPHNVWLPDAFTPNGDGRNDLFRIITDNPNVYGIDLNVYNRWGTKVHISHGSNDGWDGRINGKDADAGTYFWTLQYRVLGTEASFFKKGDLLLIR